MNPGVADRHLVIILTDAAPNDSQRILPSQDSPFGHDYSDDISVNDAAEEVRALRAKGIHVSAVFMEMMRRPIAQKRFMEKNLQEYVVLMSWQRRQEDLYKKRFSR